jgi:uncharacterized protein
MAALRQTSRTTAKRRPDRVGYDRAAADAILDEALVCHVGFVVDGQPFVVPTVYVRVGECLYVHGAAAGRMTGAGAAGLPLCVTVTLLDGVVLARSAFRHSVNYRSVVVLGTATEVAEPAEKRRILAALIERVSPGRSRDVRPPSDAELRATRMFALPIDEASVKVRTGPPVDDPGDAAQPCWAGVVPLATVIRAAVPDAPLVAGVTPPALGRIGGA